MKKDDTFFQNSGINSSDIKDGFGFYDVTLDKDDKWWGETYNMIKRGYRRAWLFNIPKVTLERIGVKVEGVETNGCLMPSAPFEYSINKMRALGMIKETKKPRKRSIP
jgi:hypothetical protein